MNNIVSCNHTHHGSDVTILVRKANNGCSLAYQMSWHIIDAASYEIKDVQYFAVEIGIYMCVTPCRDFDSAYVTALNLMSSLRLKKEESNLTPSTLFEWFPKSHKDVGKRE